jgi:uncharacterized membrane protein
MRKVALVALVAAVIGFVFAAYSSYDYAQHLDRQVHSVHCSFIPGAPVSDDADNACKTALFSSYSAIFRRTYWGGIPISLFAMGAFGFFAGLAAVIAVANERTPRWALGLFGIAGIGPLIASIVMFIISATQLHTFCKLCVGIYICSIALAVCAVLALRTMRAMKSTEQPAKAIAIGFVVLGAVTLAPALVYAATIPDMKPYISACGKITAKDEAHNALIKVPTAHPARPVLLFEDPLCPSCKGFHERLVSEGIFENLDVTLALFPLDSDCNWMLDRAIHPGACILSRAILCSKTPRQVLEWSFAEQDDLRETGKKDPKALASRVTAKFPEVQGCIDDPKTVVRLNQHLHFASQNKIPISTPQMFLGETRICEEDTDLGLAWTLGQLAPEVLK